VNPPGCGPGPRPECGGCNPHQSPQDLNMHMLAACTLALVLLMDVSGSVTNRHYELQQQGLVSAFEDPQLQQIILSQPDGVVIQLQQFGTDSEVVVNWQHLRSPRDIQRFVRELAQMQRAEPGGSTGIGVAMRRAIEAFDHAPCTPEQRVIDVSADGESNVGVHPSVMRDLAQELAIQVNGLPIVSEQEPELADYFRSHVITPDGFVVVADGVSDFARAIRRKLTLEIAQR
jgi:Ca-activated chloride channel homolog